MHVVCLFWIDDTKCIKVLFSFSQKRFTFSFVYNLRKPNTPVRPKNACLVMFLFQICNRAISSWDLKQDWKKTAPNEDANNSKWVFRKIGVPPKSSIFLGFSITNHPFWGTPIFGNTQMPTTIFLKQLHLKSSNWCQVFTINNCKYGVIFLPDTLNNHILILMVVSIGWWTKP